AVLGRDRLKHHRRRLRGGPNTTERIAAPASLTNERHKMANEWYTQDDLSEMETIEVTIHRRQAGDLNKEQITHLCQRLQETATKLVEGRGTGDELDVVVAAPSQKDAL